MKRFRGILAKALLALAGLGVLAAVLAPIALRRLLPPEKLRAVIVSGAQKSLRRQVTLGDISFSLLSGLALKDLKISEAPTFEAGTFASMSAFNVKVRWMPLLKRRVVIDTVSAEGLALRIIKNPDGTFNFSDLTQAGAKGAAVPAVASGAASPSGEVELAIRSASVADGRLVYEESALQRTVTITALDAKVQGFAMSGLFSAEISARASGQWDAKPFDGAGSFSGRLDLGGQDPRKVLAEIKALELSTNGWVLRASGAARDLSRPTLDLKASLNAGGGPIGDAEFKGVVTPPVAGAGLSLEGALKLRTDGLKTVDAAALNLPPGLTVPPFKVSGELAYSGDAARFKQLHLETLAGVVEASGQVAGLASGKPSADLEAALNLSLPAFRSADVAWAKLPEGLALPPFKIAGKARIKGDSVTIPEMTLRGAFGALQITGAARKLSTKKPDIDLEVGGKLDLPELRAADLPWAALPAGFISPAAAIEGKARLKGDDLTLTGLTMRVKEGTVEVTGAVRGLTSGAAQPDLELSAKLSLPAIKSADLPFSAVPLGLALPASQWDGSLSLSRDEIKIRSLRLIVGHNDFQIEAGRLSALRSDNPLVNLTVKCRSFQLEELTQLSPGTRELALTGSGFFALAATGRLPRPILEGKLQFKDLGAVVSGLKLSGFTGTASFNERRIDVPNLRGSVAEGQLEMNLTIKDYAKAPDIDLEASLTQFDLASFMAAKAAMTAPKPSAQAAAATPASDAKAPAPVSARGKLSVGLLRHSNAQARDVRLAWDLTGMTPDLKRLGGWAKLSSSGGRFSNLGEMATQSKIVKVLLFPLMVFQKIGTIGGLKLFPDFNNVEYTELAGDYAFNEGVMTLRDSHLHSTAGNVTASGSIDLPAERLNLTVSAQVARLAPIDVDVRGSFAQPRSSLKVGKFLADPAKQLLESIFKK